MFISNASYKYKNRPQDVVLGKTPNIYPTFTPLARADSEIVPYSQRRKENTTVTTEISRYKE
jgi:hypothetical protein